MSRMRTFFRRLRTIAWTALTLVTLLAAVMVGVGKLLMPYSQRYQPQLEAWMSREFNQPVRIDSFTGEWKAFGPRISLEGVNLLGSEGAAEVIAIEQAALDIKPFNVLLAGRPLYSFRIIGADLQLVRDLEGQFHLSGLGVSGRETSAPGGGLSRLARLGEVVLEQGRLSYDDEARNVRLQLSGVNGRLRMDGRDLAVQVEAGVSDAATGTVLGDLGATLTARLDRQQRLSRAAWHVETGEMALAEIAAVFPERRLAPESGWLNAELWGAWGRDQPQRMEGVLDIRDASLQTDRGPLALDHLNTRFRWRFSERRIWRIDLSDTRIREGGRDWSSPSLVVERNMPGGLGVWVSADYLEVGFPLQLTQHLMGLFNARWPRNAPRAGSGQVRDFHILIDSDRQFAGAGGRFENLTVADWDRWPNLAGLEGSAELAFGEGDILFSGHDVQVEWPGQFRTPALVDIPACALEMIWSRQDWQIDVRECSVSNEAIALHGRTRFAGVRGVEGKPEVDVNLVIERANIADLHDYWPQRVIAPNVRTWLERALRAGEVRDGRFILQGDMDRFPFRGGEGTLDARIDFDAATIAFHPDWPAAAGVQGMARFRGPGMTVTGSIGDLGGVPVSQATARIEDFQAARLDLEYDGAGTLPRLVGFIRATPLLGNSTLDLDRFRFDGPARTRGRLVVPLGRTPGELTVEGRLELPGDSFAMPAAGFALSGISGRLDYDRLGFRGESLEAHWRDHPAKLTLRADWSGQQPFSATMSGRFPVADIVAQTPLRDDPLAQRLSGDAEWVARLAVSREQPAATTQTWLHLESSLLGVTVALPAPLSKQADTAWPLRLAYPVEATDPVLDLSIADRARLRMVTGGGLSQPRSAALGLGGGVPAQPQDGLFVVQGTTPELDLDGWIEVVREYVALERPPGGLVFDKASLQAGQLLLFDRLFDDVAVEASYDTQVLTTQFSGEAIEGTTRYSRGEGQAHTLGANFERLYLPAPVDHGVKMQSDPATLPEMHLFVRDFRFKDLRLGETRLEAFPQGSGLRIDSLEAVSEQMNFQARGEWLAVGEGHRSDFDIVMTAESLGALINAMNLSSVLEGGQTMVRYDAWWPGSPAAFALEALNGEMTFNVVDGRILNADPGAGRVLGLISVAALPRRLALDFRDVFETGFGFEVAHGTVRLENGTASTNDFVLESTAALLSVAGASDLVNQTFDYEMSVRPGVSQALPVIGALAAGPPGVAAGLALQGLLREALGDATEARYRITGPWSQPEVIRLEVPAAQRGANASPTQERSEND